LGDRGGGHGYEGRKRGRIREKKDEKKTIDLSLGGSYTESDR
jgi:hypothetical protein